jgi:Flp pilus assembly protein TadD
LLRRATALSGDQPQYWSDYAIALSQAGKTDDAVAAYRTAIARGVGSPNEFVFWYNMGYALWQARRYEPALEAFERVLEIAPRDDPMYDSAVTARGYCLGSLRR